MSSFYYCVKHHKVETEENMCPPIDRLGPFGSREEAELALETAAKRNEDWDHDPRAIANVRTYLADYRALTPEDVRRAVATYVTDQGDWSMLVLPARGAATTAAPARDANGHNQ